MDKLKKVFDFLRSDPEHTMEVWDMPNDIKIESKKYRPDLTSYDAFKAEMNSFIDHFTKVGLQRFKMKGNASVREGAFVVISKKKTDVDPGGDWSNPLPSQHQNINGMNGMFGNANARSQGLGIAEIGKISNYDNLKSERDKAISKLEKISEDSKNKIEDLKEERQELKQEIYQLKHDKSMKPGAFDKLLENPEVLTGILSTVAQTMQKGGGAAQQLPQPGMNAPQLSQIKQKFITDLVKMDPDDKVVMRLVYLLKCYIEGKTEVITEFEKLYKDATSQHQQ